ncbi:ATP-binding protein [Flammeovirga sp. EKP202]|uniref:sensor histidine kinase n=1 Tax=Flammeovirga sp. EKP202 TaxID=2770592 RepID=UPI00165FF8A9|nr:ATP-binding protein [Flammeovirga sp. EKP202]MBD0400871.1 type IV pili methyl-accepting chemotaxis transducer N-terminal domain-containing protein [Flammeovirga sp. EKP202]
MEQTKNTFTLASKIEHLSLKKLWTLYFTAITAIILLLSISQIVFHSFSQKQNADADLINKAGKQRMLSQKITKCVLLIENNKTTPYLGELKNAVKEWKISHKELGAYNDQIDNSISLKKATELYEKVDAFHSKIVSDVEEALENNFEDSDISQDILSNEAFYLTNMDLLVGVYSDDANGKLDDIQNTSLILFIITLILLFFELGYVFRPTARRIRKTFDELEKAKSETQDKIVEIDQLYRSLGQSYQFLSESKDNEEKLNVLLAKTDENGEINYVSDALLEILKVEHGDHPKNIFHWLTLEGYKKEMIQEVLETALSQETWVGTLQITDSEGDYIWIETTITMLHGEKPTIVIIGRDTTEDKEAEERSKEINQEEIDKHIETQKERSLLILKGQEEERGRISKDIHDGIGQLLTALKFSLESFDGGNTKSSANKIKESRNLLKNIIREVRRVSFNLSPNTLGDYGINAVLTRFANETSRLSDVTVLFNNKTDFNMRFERHIETNIYRIVQEAVNNAIKYSEAEQVKIDLEHDIEVLYISIVDNGKGFDMKNLEIQGGGNGLLNMEERAGFVGGTIQVSSKLEEGTTISVEVPINKD